MPRDRRDEGAAVTAGARRLEEMKMLAAKERPTTTGKMKKGSGLVRLENQQVPETERMNVSLNTSYGGLHFLSRFKQN